MPAFRILYRVPIQTQDIKTFHSMEEYRVADLKYGVSSILKNCDFLSFFAKNLTKIPIKKVISEARILYRIEKKNKNRIK